MTFLLKYDIRKTVVQLKNGWEGGAYVGLFRQHRLGGQGDDCGLLSLHRTLSECAEVPQDWRMDGGRSDQRVPVDLLQSRPSQALREDLLHPLHPLLDSGSAASVHGMVHRRDGQHRFHHPDGHPGTFLDLASRGVAHGEAQLLDPATKTNSSGF